ncbi:hypothetical protein FACS189493_0820 [Spirochaetia bacterium]|nr:hypothetical protein FACS189493_0820 [Spirochaetia bacterium]
MSFKKPVLISVGISLVLGAFGVFAAEKLIPRGSGRGYALLSLDEVYADRDIAEALDAIGIADYISQSTQWVYLDDFGELRQIPLDRYPDQVESFDPRNDGYAETLDSFFVRDGKRRFFIPLNLGLSNRSGRGIETLASFANRLAAGGLPPYSFEPLLASQPVSWFLILFTLAAVAAVILSPSRVLALALVPPAAGLAFAGSGGLALGGLLFALFSVLLTPLRELFAARRRYGLFRRDAVHRGVYTGEWVFAAVLALIYGGICVFAAIPPALGLLVSGSFLAVLAAVLWAESNRGYDHVRFFPVPIRLTAVNIPRYSRPMFGFTLAALIALILPLAVTGPGLGEIAGAPDFGAPPRLEDYEDHLAFQSSFSTRPLGSQERQYASYYLGDDGLIAGSRDNVDSLYGDFPPFPLEDLTAFIKGYSRLSGVHNTPRDIIPVLAVVVLSLIGLVPVRGKNRKTGSPLVYHHKQAAA